MSDFLGCHILIVDDDAMNLHLARHMLGKSYQVECVSSCKEALAYLDQHVPALALLDIHMPGMNGFELLSEIRKMEKCKDLPVIFLTADNDPETEIQVFQAGALDFIQKPFVPEIVLERIKRILALRKLQNHLECEVERRTAELQESYDDVKSNRSNCAALPQEFVRKEIEKRKGVQFDPFFADKMIDDDKLYEMSENREVV